MATDFGTIDDTFVDHNTIHTLRNYSDRRTGSSSSSAAARSVLSVSNYGSSFDLGSCDDPEGYPTALKVGQCLEMLREVAEEWKQQNTFSADGDHKEVMQRQIETLQAIRRNYIDELVYFLEMTHNSLRDRANEGDV